AEPAPVTPPPALRPTETRTAQAPDPLAERRITSGGAGGAAPRDGLEERRVAPSITSAPSATSADDTLDSRRTITSGRTGRPTSAPPPAVVTTPVAPPPAAAARTAPPPPATMPATVAPPAPRPPAVAAATPPPPAAPAPRAIAPAPAAVVGTAPAFIPPRPTVGVAPGETVVSQTFARMLAESASTVTTAPAHVTFSRPTAAPLGPRDTTAPAIVRETFNQSLSGTPATLPAPGTAAPAAPIARTVLATPGATVVRFGNNSAKVEADYAQALQAIANSQRTRGGKVRIIGYASNRSGTASEVDSRLANFRISLDRAQSVANELMRLGVPAQAIFMEGRGEDRRFSVASPQAEAESRRAEVFLES
ncbi:MAG: OmpA family protein, partial [Alphaproteobacteria bacterium]|nr:OmpA family protein [Alphaproteobacteria bacterium]